MIGADQRGSTRLRIMIAVAILVVSASCSSGADADEPTSSSPTTEAGEAGRGSGAELRAGAASRSILPTVGGKRDYLSDVPGWPSGSDVDPDDPGVLVPTWDQGRVDVGNGAEDSAWVHDDLTATAVAIERGSQRVVLVSTDTYMHFAPDADEMVKRAHGRLPEEWADAPILIAATHLHEGPDTAFSVNDDWYALMADQTADAVAAAVDALEPARLGVASGTHGYGVNDARDPIVMDRRLNVMTIDAAASGQAIATVVQWGSHPETTLGWSPPAKAAGLDRACPAKGWEGDDCSAEGRYLTADYPGVLRTRLRRSRGGEVLYLNGAIGSQIGPGLAPTWVVDGDHPATDDGKVPAGAQPLTKCDGGGSGGSAADAGVNYMCKSFAKTESIGTELAKAVTALADRADPVEVRELAVQTESFFTRLTNIGFRVLLADGSLGWQDADLYTCKGHPAQDNCTKAPHATEEDPILTPLADSKIVVGDVVKSRITRLDLGDVGFLFMPGELPPELVVGLPDDFNSDPGAYYREPDLHAVGADYKVPGALLDLVDEPVTFTVGLGTDELGYFVPIDEYRLRCLDLALPGGAKCADLAARGVIESPDYIGGRTCATITDDPTRLADLGPDGPAVAAICRYGQALGRELGEPDGHYEETNSAGWDLVDDLWAAAKRLFDR